MRKNEPLTSGRFASFGIYLDVDLSSGSVSDYEIPNTWFDQYLGGRGIATRILLEELQGGENPLGPENILVFAAGPLQGSGVAGAGRHAVVAKSPKNRTFNESYCGGFWGHELGQSGYDGIIIRGKAARPVYLVVQGREGSLFPADDLWGSDVGTTDRMLKHKHEGVRVTCIGPAGENRVMFASIITDRNRASGRPAFGAVMGSKNLKAVAVRGDVPKPFFDASLLASSAADWNHELMEDPKIQNLGKLGTAAGVEPLNELGILPTKHFRAGSFDRVKMISGEAIRKQLDFSRATCAGCPVACKVEVCGDFNGVRYEKKYGGPEYETIAAFGSLCLNADLPAICLANQECNRLGLDTIGVGVAIAFAMEASEAGFLAERIEWGDPHAVVALVQKIARNEGVGKLLAQGVDEAARELGCEHLAMTIKGQEIPMHEPRGKKGLAISYATSPRGATHLESYHDTLTENLQKDGIPELGLFESMDRLSYKGKAEACKAFEDYFSFLNSCILCSNITWANIVGAHSPIRHILRILQAATGREVTPEEMMEVGERNYVLRKILASEDGYRSDDDKLPARFYEPLEGGSLAGENLDHEKLAVQINEYYKLRGFDRYGPLDSKLQQLGIQEFAHRMQRAREEKCIKGQHGLC